MFWGKNNHNILPKLLVLSQKQPKVMDNNLFKLCVLNQKQQKLLAKYNMKKLRGRKKTVKKNNMLSSKQPYTFSNKRSWPMHSILARCFHTLANEFEDNFVRALVSYLVAWTSFKHCTLRSNSKTKWNRTQAILHCMELVGLHQTEEQLINPKHPY